MPRYTHLTDKLPASVPFVGPEAQERARGELFTARLGANENVFGPSPHAIKAMADALTDIWKYGDPESHDLRQALAKHHEIPPDNIVVGEGIDALLGYLVRLIIGPGDHVVTSAGAYPTFNYHVTGFGGKLVTTPYKNDHEDPDALIAMAHKTDAKIIYLANPDNPMGTWHNAVTLAKMIAQIPKGCLLVLDEAYLELAPDNCAPALDTNDKNVIRMRTFSKAYGMAGARVGYAIAQAELIDAFSKVRNHFGMCRVSQLGALAALNDTNYLSQVIENISISKEKIALIGARNGLRALPSAANFVALDCGKDGDHAKAVLDGLIARGVFVRMPFVAPQNRCIRVSAGTRSDLDALAAALPKAIIDANSA